ncbi:MAG: IS630 transposase-related protein [Pseudomonadota bacterium]
MGKSHPIELRTRVVEHVEAGHSHRAASRHFRVSVKFVNDMVKLKRETGGLLPKAQGRRSGQGKLAPYCHWIEDQLNRRGDVTLDGLVRDLKAEFGIDVHRGSIGRRLQALNYTHKKRRFTPKSNTVRT